MSTFVSKVSLCSGKAQWVFQPEDYDYQQEIARSAYADMLHDTERNKKYEAGLISAINTMRSRGRPCNVLDIGTGTGLLSMMAVRNGADSVTACDAFEPAAKCAEKIIAANGMAGRINIIKKRSTDIKIPDDMDFKANILVTEVFDTELIGEGAITTFRHALQYLLEPDCIVIPSAARMYIQPVESSYLATRNDFKISLPEHLKPINVPSTLERYNNDLAAPLFDLQLSQLPQELFEVLSPGKIVFRFDFCGREELILEQETHTDYIMGRDGVCHAFLMWWELDMDMNGDILLSCAPYWAHPDSKDTMQWRDHWMQAVFYPHRPLKVYRDSSYTIRSRHDEYSLTFDIKNKGSDCKCTETTPAMLHCVYTRPRLAMLQDTRSISLFCKCLERIVDKDTTVLCASEGSFLPFLLARLGVAKVIVVDSNFVGARKLTQSVIDYNDLQDHIKLYQSYDSIPQQVLSQVTLVVGEPYFSISMLPWDDLYFWYVASSLSSAVKVVPKSAHLMAIAVEFDDLHKIRAPVGDCEGLDLSIYDHMIEKARQSSDEYVEPQPLWEYPSTTLSEPYCLLELDLSQPVFKIPDAKIECRGKIPIQHDGSWNGIALWMVYKLDDGYQVSHGLTRDVRPGERPIWNMERKQAVHLPMTSHTVNSKSNIHYIVSFNTESGDMNFNFSVS